MITPEEMVKKWARMVGDVENEELRHAFTRMMEQAVAKPEDRPCLFCYNVAMEGGSRCVHHADASELCLVFQCRFGKETHSLFCSYHEASWDVYVFFRISEGCSLRDFLRQPMFELNYRSNDVQ